MKKFIIHIAIFGLLFLLADVGAGLCLDYINGKAKGGNIQKRNYIATECKTDIMLFGSSRMSHHYVPQLFEDSLGMSCYNAGEDGNGIILATGLLDMMLKQHRPKLIVYDISVFDSKKDDNLKHIAYLRSFSDNPDVMDIICRVDPSEQWKLKSKLYTYNSQCLRMLGAVFSSPIDKGYLPLGGVMNYEPEKAAPEAERELDPLKLEFMEAFIKTCKAEDIPLVFLVSPLYKSLLPSVSYPEIENLCECYGVPFLDYADFPAISNDKLLFQDQSHLNHNGATIYTNHIINYLTTNGIISRQPTQ